MVDGPTVEIQPIVLGSADSIWQRVRGRLDDIEADEFLWEPVEGCWSIRVVDGRATADREMPPPERAPVTTIAWRSWHIAVECLESYSERVFGSRALPLDSHEWYLDPLPARRALDDAWSVFREGMASLGEEGLWRKLGPAFGPFADDTNLALLLHAQDEISHHGAEIALLRDLYRNR